MAITPQTTGNFPKTGSVKVRIQMLKRPSISLDEVYV
jgi:hypothetical protein